LGLEASFGLGRISGAAKTIDRAGDEALRLTARTRPR
jgi:hypothetical protein